MVQTNGSKHKAEELRVDPRLPFNAWLDPGANRMGLGIVSVEKVTPNDVPVRVIPSDDASIRRMGGLLTATIGARAAVDAMIVLGFNGEGRHSGAWATDVEVDCPECASVWRATVQEVEGERLEVTHMAYGCDHRAVLNEIEESAIESAQDEVADCYRALNDEAAARGY